MKKFIPRALGLLILISLPGLVSRSERSAEFHRLTSGQFQQIDQNIQINVVFVGYDPGNGPHSGKRLPLGVASDPGQRTIHNAVLQVNE